MRRPTPYEACEISLRYASTREDELKALLRERSGNISPNLLLSPPQSANGDRSGDDSAVPGSRVPSAVQLRRGLHTKQCRAERWAARPQGGAAAMPVCMRQHVAACGKWHPDPQWGSPSASAGSPSATAKPDGQIRITDFRNPGCRSLRGATRALGSGGTGWGWVGDGNPPASLPPPLRLLPACLRAS